MEERKMNMEFKRKLPIPMEIKEMYPLSEELAKEILLEKDIYIIDSSLYISLFGPYLYLHFGRYV